MPDFFGKLKSGAEKAAFEAEKMVRVNRAQGELGQLKKQKEGLFTKLGEMYYLQFTGQKTESPDYASVCANIADLDRQVEAKNEEVQRLNAEVHGSQAAAPVPTAPPVPAQATVEPVNVVPAAEVEPAPAPVEAAPTAQTKFCPNCGREMAATAKFCPDCGTKMA
ncbi:MAG TPA: zinc ribbon domain-containing protein [Anaerolineales bacterium]